MRAKPRGTPVMQQNWRNLLFLHWPMDPEVLRPFIPESLELDTFEGKAWIGITPFHLEDLRPLMLPPVPGLSEFHECNVRTYVQHQGRPGIWFFSLDASKLLPALAARFFFMLPYFPSNIRYTQKNGRFSFSLRRNGPPPAELKVSWTTGVRLRDPDKDSLAFFLVERYCAFAVEANTVYKIRIYHPPWILDEASVELRASSLISSLGLPGPAGEPLAHFSTGVEAQIWPPTPI
jgi:uncharacterized protein